jgi:RNA recognition motif-containing protein
MTAGQIKSLRCAWGGGPHAAWLHACKRGGCILVARRLPMDRTSGRVKGFAFCEYYDRESAEAAVRSLNSFDLCGRPVRVAFADESHQPKPKEDPEKA